jgi:2-oxoglutarate ferredoxin oxidoreductase subunit delta
MTEKRKKKGKIEIDRERCKACYLCIEVCPTKTIDVDKSLNKKGYFPAHYRNNKNNKKEDEKGCIACAQCATVCPEVAIEVYRAK